MKWAEIFPRAIQYAIAAFISWLLITQQISESLFLTLFLIYGLGRFALRKKQPSE